jgi:hypothetical protein
MYDPGDEDTLGVRTTEGPNVRSFPGGTVRPNSAASSLNWQGAALACVVLPTRFPSATWDRWESSPGS